MGARSRSRGKARLASQREVLRTEEEEGGATLLSDVLCEVDGRCSINNRATPRLLRPGVDAETHGMDSCVRNQECLTGPPPPL